MTREIFFSRTCIETVYSIAMQEKVSLVILQFDQQKRVTFKFT